MLTSRGEKAGMLNLLHCTGQDPTINYVAPKARGLKVRNWPFRLRGSAAESKHPQCTENPEPSPLGTGA